MVSGTPDDKRVRLFGIVWAKRLLLPVSKAAEVAKTLHSLGFNAVRKMDAAPTDDENVSSALARGHTQVCTLAQWTTPGIF